MFIKEPFFFVWQLGNDSLGQPLPGFLKKRQLGNDNSKSQPILLQSTIRIARQTQPITPEFDTVVPKKTQECGIINPLKEVVVYLPATAITSEIITGERLEISGLISLMISKKSPKCTRPGLLNAKVSTALSFYLLSFLIHNSWLHE